MVTEYPFWAVNCSAATTVFIVSASTPGLAASSSRITAEWIPEVIGCTVTVKVTGLPSGRLTDVPDSNVPSLPTQLTAYVLVPPPPLFRVSV